MDHDQRPFQPVRVSQIGVEHGSTRFNEEEGARIPPVSRWRNNLTALSQKHNLYFIASDSGIAVYEPDFPFQTLGNRYSMYIQPAIANGAAPGYLSSRRNGISDHCINHLILGELGNQEILLLSADSGNVVAYYTNAVWEAVQKEPYRFSEKAYADPVGLRPFFSQWVHQSAWGLSIHRQARMIAVSANTPNEAQPPTRNDFAASITVYAFALIEREHQHSDFMSNEGNDSDMSTEESEWNTWIPLKDGSPPSRDRNYKILLSGFDGHDNNIPNISFVNTSEDEEGAWLLSTDISGAMKLWQVWKQKCWKTWEFGNHNNSRALWMNQSYPGWNVAALDLKCFRTVTTTDELIGFHRAPMYFGYNDQGDSYDITQKVRRLTPGASEFHPLHPVATSINDQSESGETFTYLSDSDDDDEQPFVDAEPSIEISVTENEPLLQQDTEVDLAMGPTETSDIELDSEADDDVDSSAMFSDDGDDVSTHDEGITGYALPADAGVSESRQNSHIHRKESHLPAIAILHCSDSHVRLLSGPRAKYPHLFCAHILRQILPNDINRSFAGLEFSHMDRLNMIQTIPELGLVVVATQTGRIAACSLTRRTDGFLGLRVDWILPTKQQERNGARPNLSVLVGMAVGPVQGRLEPQSQSSSDDEYGTWGVDSNVDGVPISFDPIVVRLTEDPGWMSEHDQRDSSKSNPPRISRLQVQRASWKRPLSIPSWKLVENSRRYRLMLTYSDLSVLTYEVWRDVEKSDIAGSDEE